MPRDVTTCPIDGCHRQHSRSLLMCPHHWGKVSTPTQQRVYKAYRSEGVLSEAYQAARIDAIAEAIL
jgi:hypothetical protein